MNNIIWIAAIAGGLAWGACTQHGGHDHHNHDHHNHDHENDHEKEALLTFSRAQAQSVGIVITEIQPEDFNSVINATGELTATTSGEAVVSATSNGILSFAKQDLVEGSPIRTGMSLAVISAKNIADGDPQTKLRLQYEMAERRFQRADLLLQEQLISQKAYEEALLGYETARTAYSGLQSASGGIGVRLSSPIDGYLKNRLVEEGAYVAIGQPILTVTRNKRLQLCVEVSQKYRQQLPLIHSAHFKLPFDDRVYQLDSLNGQLKAYGVVTDASTAFLPISFELDNTGSLPIGSYVEVFLLTRPIHDALAVPKTALIEEQGVYSVFVQDRETAYRKQEITIGQDDGQRVHVRSGLQPGDRVVTHGAIHIKLANMATAIPHGHSH